jgi:hypothetical protein
MDWHLAWVFIVKVALVSGAIWIAYIVGFVVGWRLGGRDDIASTYTAALGVILAWTTTSALTMWLAGLAAFILGVLLLVAIIGTVSSIARRGRRKPMS